MHYELNCGQCVLMRNGAPATKPIDTLAICLDKATGTRHKFGEPQAVRAWHSNAQEALRAAGHPDFAEQLVVIEGRFTLDDINLVIDNSTHAHRLYLKVMAGTADALDMHGNVVCAKQS